MLSYRVQFPSYLKILCITRYNIKLMVCHVDTCNIHRHVRNSSLIRKAQKMCLPSYFNQEQDSSISCQIRRAVKVGDIKGTHPFNTTYSMKNVNRLWSIQLYVWTYYYYRLCWIPGCEMWFFDMFITKNKGLLNLVNMTKPVTFKK